MTNNFAVNQILIRAFLHFSIMSYRRNMINSHLRIAFIRLISAQRRRDVELDTIISLIEYLLSVEAGNLIECCIDANSIAVNLIISSFLNFGYHHTFKSFKFPSQIINN